MGSVGGAEPGKGKSPEVKHCCVCAVGIVVPASFVLNVSWPERKAKQRHPHDRTATPRSPSVQHDQPAGRRKGLPTVERPAKMLMHSPAEPDPANVKLPALLSMRRGVTAQLCQRVPQVPALLGHANVRHSLCPVFLLLVFLLCENPV